MGFRIKSFAFVFGVSVLFATGCTKSPDSTSTGTAGKVRVGLVLDKGGRDDKSFNASAFEGATRAEKELGIELKTVECSDDASIEPALRTFAQRGYDIVIAIGFVMGGAMEKVAKQFPDTRFAVIDTKVDVPNVRSIQFKEHEGSFLVGAIGALTSKTAKVGFIGGMDVPLIRRFELGYRSGVRHVAPKAAVTTNYVGSTSEAWKNPMKAKELALSQYREGNDVIFAPAGASAMGLFDAAEEMKKFAIGVDSNQNWVKPGFVLTSMVKRVDKGVFDAIDQVKKKTFTGGEFHLGLKEDGVAFALDEYNKALIPADVLKRVEALRDEIIAGRIQVPDYYITKTIPNS